MKQQIVTNRKAEMGVGTLIIFIALLLVAAVAAGVLIQTAGSLQQKALSTGTQATGQISTNALVLEVSAEDGTAGTGGGVDTYNMIMKLAPGSEPIKLDDVTLTFSGADFAQNLEYDSVLSAGNTSDFAVAYLQTGANSQTGVLVRGDVINLNFGSERNITESEDVRINFIPKIGTATLVEFSLPDVVSTQRVYLYP